MLLIDECPAAAPSEVGGPCRKGNMLPLKLAAMVTAIAYLFTRIVFTWHGANPVLFGLLLIAEVFGMWRLWMEASLFGSATASITSPGTGTTPSTDAIVVVTDEPASEVRAAVLSARAIVGVDKVWIVDRDDRREVTELARRLGVETVAGRSNFDDSEIGPLVNSCLRNSESLLAVLIPADMVVLPDLLTTTAPSFADPALGAVVCREENTNAAKLVDYGGYGVDQIRDRLIVPKLASMKSLPWMSGLTVLRRHEVLECGGLGSGPGAGTLDAGMRLSASGMHIGEVPVIVARRLASWTDDRKLHRWSRALEEQLSFLKSASAGQRRRQLPRLSRRLLAMARIQALQPVQRMVLVGVLLLTLFTSSLPMTGDVLPLALLWAAWHTSSVLLRRSATRDVGFLPWITSDLRLATTNLSVAIRVARNSPLSLPLHDRAPGRLARTVMLVALRLVLIGTLLAFVSGSVRTSHGDFITFTALSLGLWLLMATLQAKSGMKLGQVRQSFRTFEELKVIEGGSKMAVIGVSPSGIDVLAKAPMTVGETLSVVFALPQPDGRSVRFASPAVVKRSGRQGRYYVSYLTFKHLSDDEFDQVLMYCSVVAGERLLRDQNSSEGLSDGPSTEPSEEPETSVAEMVADEA